MHSGHDDTTLQLRMLDPSAVPGALDKARQYRLLNEPVEAESICLDVLEVEPDNREASLMLLLSLTDQLDSGGAEAFNRARQALDRLEDAYQRAYYAGLICERKAKAVLSGHGRRAGAVAYEWFMRALEHYEEAIQASASNHDDATLRWNTCLRIIRRHPSCAPDQADHIELGLE